jgi:hypothetical protein
MLVGADNDLQDGYKPHHHHCHYHRAGAAHHRRDLEQVQMSHFPFASVQVWFGVFGAQFVVYISVAGAPPGLMTSLNKLRRLSQRNSMFAVVSFHDHFR